MKKTYQFAATIGWDWADKKHDLWLCPVGACKPEHLILPHTSEAIHEWVAKMRERFGGQPLAICVETSRGPVISALMAYDFIVLFPINPKALKNYRAAFCVSGAKDDRSDAMLLEQYVRCHRDKLRPMEPDTELTRTLGGLVEGRRQLVDERTRFVEQLHSVLKTYYPLAETLLGGQMTKPMATDFLQRWPDFEALQKAKPENLRRFFFKHNSRSAKLIEERLQEIAQARALTTDQAIIMPARQRVLALTAMLKPLHRSIAGLDQLIEKTLDQHPDAVIFRSLPASGACLAPRLLVAFGTDRQRFASHLEVAQFYGVAPVIRQSGTTKTVHVRSRCPKFGRQSFHENAGCALREEPWANVFHECYKEKHDGRHHQANRSLAFKLIRIYYACWKNREVYDPARYNRALETTGSPYAPSKHPPKPAKKQKSSNKKVNNSNENC
jgi:transposase